MKFGIDRLLGVSELRKSLRECRVALLADYCLAFPDSIFNWGHSTLRGDLFQT